MKSKTLFKFAIITGVIGLFMIFSVILSNIDSSDIFFSIFTPLGLLFTFLSVILGFISWLWYLKDTIKNKQYVWAVFVGILGILIVLKEIIRIL